MKKALKVVAIISGVLLLAAAIIFVMILRMLPSPWEVKRAVSPKQMENPQDVASATPATSRAELPQKPSAEIEKTYEQKVESSKELNLKILKEDFLNEQVPLATICDNLPWAARSRSLATSKIKPQDFLKEFGKTVDRDPIIESTGPILRYLFRQSQMKNLVDMVNQAEESNDQGFMKKAEFYAQILRVAQQIQQNKKQFDQVTMKSYNLFILSKAIGLKPELAKDPATLNFCRQLESNTNLHQDFNADEQALELQKFLDYAQVKATEIGYDPAYRANMKFVQSANSLRLGGLWLDNVFELDAKAEEAIKKSLPEKTN